MLGLMQDQPLSISSLIEFAARHHHDAQIVSRRVEGDIHRYTYRDAAARARRVANALDRLGLAFSDRVATLAWNGYRHLELYFGISGSGRVVHTLNPRLAPDQVAWIANHAEDRVLCFDMTFLPLVKAVWRQCPTVKHWIALCDADALPADSGIDGLQSYEAWIGRESDTYAWPVFDEKSAATLCYTSGTTGNPKGALYSHRSTVLHAWGVALPDSLSLSARDCILPVVPMFHVNAWGMPYAAAMTGAKLVFPGPALDGKSVYELLEAEQVTMAAGVPTVWLMLLNHVRQNGLKFTHMKRTVIGGSACPPAMIKSFRDDLRRHRAARLGHDRDVAGRHGVQPEAGPARARPRGATRDHGQAGPGGVWRRDAHRRPRRQGAAVGRPGQRRPAREGAVDHLALLQGRGR